MPELAQLYEIFANMPIVSISNAQRKPLSRGNWQRTVYHRLPAELYTARQEHGSYLAFLAWICPEKTTRGRHSNRSTVRHDAQGRGQVDAPDRHYYGEVIEPLLDERSVEFIGEVKEDGK